MDLNLYNNYGHMIASDITTHKKVYVYADSKQKQKKDKLYHYLKNSLTASGTEKYSPRAPSIT